MWEEYHNEENRQKFLFSGTLPFSVGRETICKISKLYSALDGGTCYRNKARKGACGVGELIAV